MPTPPGFADCSYEFRQTSVTRPAYVTFGVDPVDTDPAIICSQLQSAFLSAGSYKSILDSSVSLTAIRVSLGTDGTADLVSVLGTAQVGGVPGSFTPPNVAVLVHKQTSRGGRRGRGRMFLPWVTQTSNLDEGGVILPAVVTTLNAALLAWRVALNAANCPMVLLHGPGKTGMPAPDPVIGLSADRLIGTQRRRLGR
jgi:hypothetical protein